VSLQACLFPTSLGSCGLVWSESGLRAVLLPAGARQVQFHYAATPFFRGLRVTLGALGALGLWVGAAAWSERRKRRSA
jgi:hypothetical protein